MFEVTYHRGTFKTTLLDCNNNFIFQIYTPWDLSYLETYRSFRRTEDYINLFCTVILQFLIESGVKIRFSFTVKVRITSYM